MQMKKNKQFFRKISSPKGSRLSRAKQAGFGLVEVMVSIALMTSVIIALHYLSQAAFRNWQNASNKAIAYNLIQGEVEKIHNQRDKNANTAGATWNNLIVDSTGSITVDNKNFNKTITVTDVAGGPGTGTKKKVIVEIKWTESMGDKSLKSITYLTDWRARY